MSRRSTIFFFGLLVVYKKRHSGPLYPPPIYGLTRAAKITEGVGKHYVLPFTVRNKTALITL